MKNKFLRFLGATSLLIAIGSLTFSCSAEDGIDGINGMDGLDGNDGENGTDGENGEDGADGQDGIDGLGYAEFTDYGAITINVEGTRPDSVAFNHEAELKFISPEKGDNDLYNNDPDLQFDISRLFNSPNVHSANGAWMYLQVLDAGLSTQNFQFGIEFNDFIIFSDDLKYIALDDWFQDTSTGVSNFSITNYSFDDMTNNLKFSFAFDVAGANNDTGNDMSVVGSVDVIVFENASPD